MAHVQQVVSGNAGDLVSFNFYNLDEAVGQGAPDPRADDVTLVQWFLQQVYANGDKFHPPLHTPPLPTLIVTGQTSANLTKWILAFQNEFKRRGAAIYTDGRVDTCKTLNAISTISHTVYTIVVLNLAFHTARPDTEDKSFDEIPDAPDLLKIVLRRPEPSLP